MPGSSTSFVSELTLPQLTDLVRREWSIMKEYLPREAKKLYIQDYVGSGQGNSKSYNEFDGQTFAAQKPEGTNSAKASVGVGYSKVMFANTFSMEIEITLEMRNDNRYQQVGALIRDLSSFCENRQDLDLTHRFSFATSTSYVNQNGFTVDTTVGDGKALCVTNHDLAFSSIQYSNRVTGDPAFSQGSFEAAKLLGVTQTYNNYGQQRNLNWNTIITGKDPGTVRTVKQLLHSMADITAVQAGIVNVYKDNMTHVVLPYLDTTASGATDSTKRRWWFIGAIGVQGWQAYVGDWIMPELRTPAPGNNGEDIHNLNWTYLAFCRYGITALSGKGLIGSFPTS